MKTSVFKVLFVLLLGILPYFGYAEVPNTISYQGSLWDDNGNPVNEPAGINITFSIPGTTWSETHTGVPVNKGVFGVLLGEANSLAEVDFSQPHSLRIDFNDTSQTVPMSSVPYAFHAKTVQGLNPFTQHSAFAQILAQATCTALNPNVGWTFAVRRPCSNTAPSCAEVCTSLTEAQAGALQCFNALHIYSNQPFSSPQNLGFKTYKYNGCEGGGCGPNYCCCSN